MPDWLCGSELHDEPESRRRPSATANESAPRSRTDWLQSRVSMMRSPSGSDEILTLPPPVVAVSVVPETARNPPSSQRALSAGPFDPFASAAGVSQPPNLRTADPSSAQRWYETTREPRFTSAMSPAGATTNARLPEPSTASPGIKRVPTGSAPDSAGQE